MEDKIRNQIESLKASKLQALKELAATNNNEEKQHLKEIIEAYRFSIEQLQSLLVD